MVGVQPMFRSNYPNEDDGLLPTPARLGALPDYTGRGVNIAFIDSGFSNHTDLAKRILCYVDAGTQQVVEYGRVTKTDIFSWHGQMTSCICAGNGSKGDGTYRGIASEAGLVLVRITTPEGHVREPGIIRALRWLLDTHKRLNVRVVNLSVGGDYPNSDPNHPIHLLIRKLVNAGVVVLVASGNHGSDTLVPPASSSEAIIVGGYDDRNSADRDHWHMWHSNYGTAYDGSAKPDIIAPAAWIAAPLLPGSDTEREANWLGPLLTDVSALEHLLTEGYADVGLPAGRKDTPRLRDRLQEQIHSHKLISPHYQHVDGTSVAAPIAASVVAQMLQANPTLTPAQVKAMLTATAIPLSNAPRINQGAGTIRAGAAVQAALQAL